MIDALVKQIIEIQSREQETLAYKFMQETGLLPSQIELVVRDLPDGKTFSYQKKKDYPEVKVLDEGIFETNALRVGDIIRILAANEQNIKEFAETYCEEKRKP